MPLFQQGQVICIEYLACARFKVKFFTCHGGFNHHDKISESSRKTSISALLTTPKPLCGLFQQTVENSSRDGDTRLPDLPPEKSVCRSGSNSLELDMEQQTGSKLGKE